ncbi:MAG: class II aldolase/adducin family protein, partial [Clostridia bacterium]|nr:class II aldolase/adducin family protein [Clostridia bacterium]
MRFELLHPADQLVMIISRIYYYGMTTMSGGNLSIRDDNGDIWITPSGIDKGNLSRADMCQVKPDGTVIGPHRPSVELPFHQEIYRRRPDLKAILHAHPPTLVAFSLARVIPNIALIPNATEVCGKVTYAKYEVPGSKKLGEYIAEEFSKGFNTVMMENHGVVIGNKDLFSCFMAFETLDFCGRLEIDAKKLGTPKALTEDQIDIDRSITSPSLDEYIPGSHSSEECAGRRDLCELIHRSYDQRLFTSTQGTYSMRLSDGSFLTT